jgi:hypothetical protein
MKKFAEMVKVEEELDKKIVDKFNNLMEAFSKLNIENVPKFKKHMKKIESSLQDMFEIVTVK